MSKSSFDIVNGVDRLLWGVIVVVFLVIVVKIDEVGIIIIAPLSLWAVAGEMSLLTALETCIVSCIARRSLGVGNISSGCTSTSSTSSVVRGTGSIDIHWDWLVVHPSWCVGGVVLGLLLPLSSSSVLGEEWAIRCVSSRKCRKARRRVSSTSSVLRRIVASLRREDGVQ